MNCNLLGSSVPGIFQARILERVAISFSNTHVDPYVCSIVALKNKKENTSYNSPKRFCVMAASMVTQRHQVKLDWRTHENVYLASEMVGGRS